MDLNMHCHINLYLLQPGVCQVYISEGRSSIRGASRDYSFRSLRAFVTRMIVLISMTYSGDVGHFLTGKALGR